MSAKSNASSRTGASVRGKSVKKSHAVAVKRIAKAKAQISAARKLRSIKTRTLLVGMKIYPATLEPSERVKPILKDLTIKSSAA